MTIFQKIIDGEAPAHKIYEDDKVLAFLDIYPSLPGHTLVIPKQAVEFIWDLADDDYQTLLAITKKIAKHMRENLPQQFVHMSVVGIDVPHAHVHLVPFDQVINFHDQRRMQLEPDHKQLAAMADKLRLT